ncbi:hypothetical protein AMTR_s00004p00077740 [Amborella trichopoda]|uniref:NusB/RsmB/TIM44 domain-containing protein n=2 Tax=Amborella trichopoda TaxID=13333 RepID=W1NDW5_AMBTC|nr:hypothetical protein AMTR_s00004p00077740 [Amborella trichopoda]
MSSCILCTLLTPLSSSFLSKTLILQSHNKTINYKLHIKLGFSHYPGPKISISAPKVAVTEPVTEAVSSSSSVDVKSKVDKSGRFCSPRAARELSLLILYAACLEGSDPVRLFEKRVNAKRYPGFNFNKVSLLEYDHISFSGPPVSTETEEEAEMLELKYEKESSIEAEVLSAPLKLVYSKFVLRLTKKILEAVVSRWDHHVIVMDQITPSKWKSEPAGRILEHCLLHLAMAEITVIGTRHQIVINEAVDLAKRFCDGTAPRIINGCLRSFIEDHMVSEGAAAVEA